MTQPTPRESLSRAEQRERTRARILDAARTVLGRDDDAFTARGVAERAGVSPGLVLQHFDTMADLALEVFLELNADTAHIFAEVERAGGDPEAQILAVFDRLLRRDLARRALTGRVMAFAWTWTPAHEERLQASVRSLTDEMVSMLVATGRASSDDTTAGAASLLSIYNGYLRVAVTTGRDADDAFARMRSGLSILLAGLAARA